MLRLIIRLLISAAAIVVASYLLPGVSVESFKTAIAVAIVLGILNVIVEPILVLITLPITVMTFGLFLLVINALIILLADHLVDGFNVSGVLWALVFSFLVTTVSSIFKSLAGEKD